jgi:hypothetical protein
VKRWQKTAPWGAVFGILSTQSPTCAPGRFNLFLGFSRQASKAASLHLGNCCSRFQGPFLALPSPLPSPPFPPSSEGSYFGSSSSVPEMAFSRPTLRVMARGIYGTLSPTGLRPCLPRRPPLVVVLLSSSFVVGLPLRPPSLSSVLSHECTTIATPPCASSSTLDRPCVPRRDISETGEIPKGWLASAEP